MPVRLPGGILIDATIFAGLIHVTNGPTPKNMYRPRYFNCQDMHSDNPHPWTVLAPSPWGTGHRENFDGYMFKFKCAFLT